MPKSTTNFSGLAVSILFVAGVPLVGFWVVFFLVLPCTIFSYGIEKYGNPQFKKFSLALALISGLLVFESISILLESMAGHFVGWPGLIITILIPIFLVFAVGMNLFKSATKLLTVYEIVLLTIMMVSVSASITSQKPTAAIFHIIVHAEIVLAFLYAFWTNRKGSIEDLATNRDLRHQSADSETLVGQEPMRTEEERKALEEGERMIGDQWKGHVVAGTAKRANIKQF